MAARRDDEEDDEEALEAERVAGEDSDDSEASDTSPAFRITAREVVMTVPGSGTLMRCEAVSEDVARMIDVPTNFTNEANWAPGSERPLGQNEMALSLSGYVEGGFTHALLRVRVLEAESVMLTRALWLADRREVEGLYGGGKPRYSGVYEGVETALRTCG